MSSHTTRALCWARKLLLYLFFCEEPRLEKCQIIALHKEVLNNLAREKYIGQFLCLRLRHTQDRYTVRTEEQDALQFEVRDFLSNHENSEDDYQETETP